MTLPLTVQTCHNCVYGRLCFAPYIRHWRPSGTITGKGNAYQSYGSRTPRRKSISDTFLGNIHSTAFHAHENRKIHEAAGKYMYNPRTIIVHCRIWLQPALLHDENISGMYFWKKSVLKKTERFKNRKYNSFDEFTSRVIIWKCISNSWRGNENSVTSPMFKPIASND